MFQFVRFVMQTVNDYKAEPCNAHYPAALGLQPSLCSMFLINPELLLVRALGGSCAGSDNAENPAACALALVVSHLHCRLNI